MGRNAFVLGDGTILRGCSAAEVRHGMGLVARVKRLAVFVALASLVMFALNPTRESFHRYLEQRAAATPLGALHHATVTSSLRAVGLSNERYERFLLWSRGRIGKKATFAGLFGTWVEIPDAAKLLQPAMGDLQIDDLSLIGGVNAAVFLLWWLLPFPYVCAFSLGGGRAIA